MEKEIKFTDILKDEEIPQLTIFQGVAGMSEYLLKQIDQECGDVSFSVRYAQLIMFASTCDANFSDQEIEQYKIYCKDYLLITNSQMSFDKVFAASVALLNYSDVFISSLKLFKKYFSKGVLKNIAIQMYNIAGADGIEIREQTILQFIVLYWFGYYHDDEIDAVFKSLGL